MDGFLRRATPAVLLVLAGLAWFGPMLPGYKGLVEGFGEGVVLRFVVGLLCLYVAMLVVERHRMERGFREVLAAFRNFHSQARTQQGGDPAQREAIEILIGALESPEPDVRRNAAVHLQRLTGESLGEDPTAWRNWLTANFPREATQS